MKKPGRSRRKEPSKRILARRRKSEWRRKFHEAKKLMASILFGKIGRREVVGHFDGGQISSDGGVMLLQLTDSRINLIGRLAEDCFRDHRDPAKVKHELRVMLAQRILAIALGYEDVNDHDRLRADKLLGLTSGAKELLEDLASRSTLNRLENGKEAEAADHRSYRISPIFAAMDELLLEIFFESYPAAPDVIKIDMDTTNDKLHGKQEGGQYNGHYGEYCYQPIYMFVGDHLLCARLLPGNANAGHSALPELKRIIAAIRRRWPHTEIRLCGDGAFSVDDLMSWCEGMGLRYAFGEASNKRLEPLSAKARNEARRLYGETGEKARVYADFEYRTLKTWSRRRRVIAKAEFTSNGEDTRYVVTNFADEFPDARELYEKYYCARGNMENHIKAQQLHLFADRTSAHEMDANQLRLYFSSFAYTLMQQKRRIGFANTRYARAQCNTLREKFLKIGVQIRITARKVWLSFSENYTYAEEFIQAIANIQAQPPWEPAA